VNSTLTGTLVKINLEKLKGKPLQTECWRQIEHFQTIEPAAAIPVLCSGMPGKKQFVHVVKFFRAVPTTGDGCLHLYTFMNELHPGSSIHYSTLIVRENHAGIRRVGIGFQVFEFILSTSVVQVRVNVNT
jgi:hypothetical protein